MSGYNKGDAYEEEIFQICANKKIIKPGSNRAGAGSAADLVILKKGNEINIEVKYKSADWGQKYLDYREKLFRNHGDISYFDESLKKI